MSSMLLWDIVNQLFIKQGYLFDQLIKGAHHSDQKF